MPGKPDAADLDQTFAREQSVEVQDEGGLAGAVGTEERDGFARVQPEIDFAQCRGALVIAEGEAAHFDKRRHHSAPARTRSSSGMPAAGAKNAASAARKRGAANGRKRPSNPRASMAL